MGTPMGLGALAIGFWLQGVLPRSNPVNGALLEAMLENPPPVSRAAADSRDDLRGVQAERSRPRGGYGLVEPERGQPLQLDIRVAVARDAGSLVLSSTGPWWLRRADGGVVSQGGPGQQLQLSSGSMPAPELSLETTADASVSLDGRRYIGRLRLLQQPQGILAVNHLPLEAYVASVVGAEMPSSWDREALKAQAARAPDLVLADFRLAGRDSGLKAIAALRRRQPDLPALLVSGDTAEDRLRQARDAGVPLLHKPVSVSRLLEAMIEAMDRSKDPI